MSSVQENLAHNSKPCTGISEEQEISCVCKFLQRGQREALQHVPAVPTAKARARPAASRSSFRVAKFTSLLKVCVVGSFHEAGCVLACLIFRIIRPLDQNFVQKKKLGNQFKSSSTRCRRGAL